MMGHDRIYTPIWVAKDIVDYFQPTGKVLEPCKGEGAFLSQMPYADWCEIEESRDFLQHKGEYDWIISNPPYSVLREFTRHAMNMSDNVVWLMPADRYFRAWGFVKEAAMYGGLQNLRWYAGGGKLGFPMGNPIAALHWAREYCGPTTITFWKEPQE